MKIVALGHKSRVGKDTLARFMLSYLRQMTRNLGIGRVSFADKLKDHCFQMYGHLGLKEKGFYEIEYNAQYRDEPIPKIGKTPVEIWIEVGNKMREVYSNTWVDLAFETNLDIAIITDMRFPNEANKVIENNGVLVKITRDQAPVRDSESDRALDSWTDWDEVFNNNDDLQELYKFAVLLCEKYLL